MINNNYLSKNVEKVSAMPEKEIKQNNQTASEKFIEYIDIVNYQLREPVANIFASLPIMADNISSTNTESALENLNAIYRRTYSIIKCVNNLTAVSKLQSGYQYEKTAIDFSQLVKNAFQSSQMVLPAYYSLNCYVDGGCIIMGSQPLLSMALFNILLNSFEYRKEDDVQVSVELKRENGRCVLKYRDNSKGIKPEIIGRVFEPFYSSDPYNDGEISTKLGIGLYIAKQAVNQAGGTILMQSQFGSGVNIVISIPEYSDETAILKSKASDFMLNKYSEMFVQLCEYCQLPDLI